MGSLAVLVSLLLWFTSAQVSDDVGMSGLLYGLTVWMLLPQVLLHRDPAAAAVLLLVMGWLHGTSATVSITNNCRHWPADFGVATHNASLCFLIVVIMSDSSAALPASLTPSMRDVLRRMERAARTPMHELGAEAAKAAYEAGAGVLEIPKQALPRVEDLQIPARDGANLPARLYAPVTRDEAPAAGLPALLYLHGGGFTVGSVATHDQLCRQLAHLAGCMVVSLDYRLAPQFQFPVAHDDAWDALQWLTAHAASLGADGSRMAVGGDSAGGTMAAACAIEARNAGLKLALQLLIYPGTTAHQDTDSHRRFAHGLVLEEASITWFFAQYIARGQDREDWRFAPLLAPDVDDVAPAWIGLAECDPLVDEGVEYADKLRMAGVPVDLEIYKGVTHEFVKMGRVIAEARQAHRDMAQALRGAFGLN